VAVGPATAQVLVGKNAAIQIQVLVILRLREFDSPRPHKKILQNRSFIDHNAAKPDHLPPTRPASFCN